MFVVWSICSNLNFSSTIPNVAKMHFYWRSSSQFQNVYFFFFVYFYCFHLWLQPFYKTVMKLHKTFTSGSCVLLFTRWMNRFFFFDTKIFALKQINEVRFVIMIWSLFCHFFRLRLLNGAQFFWTWLSQQDDISNTFTMGSCLQSNLTLFNCEKINLKTPKLFPAFEKFTFGLSCCCFSFLLLLFCLILVNFVLLYSRLVRLNRSTTIETHRRRERKKKRTQRKTVNWRAQWRVCWASPTTMWRLKAAQLLRYDAGFNIQPFTVHTGKKGHTNIALYCVAFIVRSSVRSFVSLSLVVIKLNICVNVFVVGNAKITRALRRDHATLRLAYTTAQHRARHFSCTYNIILFYIILLLVFFFDFTLCVHFVRSSINLLSLFFFFFGLIELAPLTCYRFYIVVILMRCICNIAWCIVHSPYPTNSFKCIFSFKLIFRSLQIRIVSI